MKKILFNIILLTLMQSALGQTATFYDFNTAGQLSTLFNGEGATGSVSQLTTGGIGNSGCINLPGGTNAIFSTKEGYSLGPAGSSDTFESFIKSEGPNGYSGVGFTASAPVSASSDVYYRPTDAIGISVHGGGFIFHNGSTNYTGNWGGGSLAAGITAIKTATATSGNLIDNTSITEGSPDRWYKIIFKMTRATLSTFDMRVEVWPSNADSTIRYTTASAIFEVNGVTNTALSNAPILHSYFNFAGDRVRNFDNFTINLTGGGSVIQAGAPVVLTSSGSELNNSITVFGNVSSENGATVTERGFVYGTVQNPTTSDIKVISGAGLGTFSQSVSGLSPGTSYYVRAYAINSNGTSYGSELNFTAQTCGGDIIGSGFGTNPNSTAGIDANWKVVALPQGYTPTETLPYNAYVPLTSGIYNMNIYQTGYTVSGKTYYWIAPKNNAKELLGGGAYYNWIVQQTFTVAQSGFYDLNFSGAGDNAISFYINGVIDTTVPLLPTITGGTQIGAKHNSFTALGTFSGVTYLNAGVNTASMVMEDYGGDTVALISGSSFICNNTYVNIIPVISAVSDASIVEGAAPSPIAFTISDLETPLNNLTLTATSSNQALIPNGNIVFAGVTGSRTITTTPVLGESGTATITITLDDNAGGVVTKTFVVTISELVLNQHGQYVSDPTKAIDMYGGVGRGFGIKKSGKKINKPLPPKVGDAYQGGIIGYIMMPGDAGYDPNVQHGLIAAVSDQSPGIKWHNLIDTVTGATGTVLGTGLANTNAIIANQGATAVNYAAGLARAYAGGGYTDWYLPSKDELTKLYLNKTLIGGFGYPPLYWSSSEFSLEYVWLRGFLYPDEEDVTTKDYIGSVRAVRSF